VAAFAHLYGVAVAVVVVAVVVVELESSATDGQPVGQNDAAAAAGVVVVVVVVAAVVVAVVVVVVVGDDETLAVAVEHNVVPQGYAFLETEEQPGDASQLVWEDRVTSKVSGTVVVVAAVVVVVVVVVGADDELLLVAENCQTVSELDLRNNKKQT
jgi:hypothetical protein